MAGASATASISTTIGVAFATLLVAGGILAGPAILDCSKDGLKFGACLREKASHSGLLAPETQEFDKPALISELPPDKPPILAEVPRPQGWIEANATEFAGGPAGSIALSPGPGSLSAAGLLKGKDAGLAGADLALPNGELTGQGTVDREMITASVDLTLRLNGDLSAGGDLPLDEPATIATLSPERGGVIANGDLGTNAGTEIEVALTEPAGALTASGTSALGRPPLEIDLRPTTGALGATGEPGLAPALEASTSPEALAKTKGELDASGTRLLGIIPLETMLFPESGALSARGQMGVPPVLQANAAPEALSTGDLQSSGAPGAMEWSAGTSLKLPPAMPRPRPILKAAIEAPPATPAIEVTPKKAVPKLAVTPKKPAPKIAVAVKKSVPKPVVKFDPKYPNVIMLPPPNVGADSSFATLELN